MSAIKLAFFDMDGVLADFLPGLYAWHGCPYNGQDTLDELYQHVASRGKTSNDVWRLLDRSFWSNLTPIPEGMALYWEMRERYPVKVLTSAIDGRAVDGKIDWLIKHNMLTSARSAPEYVVFTRSKYLCAAPDRLLIDDLETNVLAFAEHGGQAMLFDRLNPKGN